MFLSIGCVQHIGMISSLHITSEMESTVTSL
jgi:hypothetical protein